jgi:UDP-glucuronate decarboxylase
MVNISRNPVLLEDMARIYDKLSNAEKKKLQNSRILITGCGGFLGYYFMHFFNHFSEELEIERIIALDNFLTGTRDWMDEMAKGNSRIKLHQFDIIKDDPETIEGIENINLVIHAASIASPTFYRLYPLETIDANITGLRRLLDYYTGRDVAGMLFFSSSEIYGDPYPEFIPTREDYNGNVTTMGPRACYDEAKRFGETLCYVFGEKYNFPVSIVRPFNNYGPGMNINDKRLPADFARCILEGRDLVMYSDGKPTRTFCYISDAITGYLKVLLYGKIDVFNIGIDKPEISVREFASLFLQSAKGLFDYHGKVVFDKPEDQHYMTDNPNRRCPDITKAKEILEYNPEIYVDEGIGRYLEFLKFNKGGLL